MRNEVATRPGWQREAMPDSVEGRFPHSRYGAKTHRCPMGLDVYLRKCADMEAADRLEAEYEKASEAAWDFGGRKYEQLTDQEKESARAACDAIATQMGLLKHGHHPDRQDADVPVSAVDPEHYFKLNYLRSSYNGSGFNRIMRNAGVADLDELFGHEDSSDYHFKPDWDATGQRIDEAIKAYAVSLNAPGGNVRVMEVSPNPFMDGLSLPSSEAEALAIYRREAAIERPEDFKSYSNRDGEFYHDGLKVRAFIHGKKQGLFRGEKRALYVVLDAAEEAGQEDWYLRALKITREMVAFVTAQPDRDHYYLSWSS